MTREIDPALVEDGIRERHGMACRTESGKAACVTVYEADRGVVLEGGFDSKVMAPWQARYLARKAYEVADAMLAEREKAK